LFEKKECACLAAKYLNNLVINSDQSLLGCSQFLLHLWAKDYKIRADDSKRSLEVGMKMSLHIPVSQFHQYHVF